MARFLHGFLLLYLGGHRNYMYGSMLDGHNNHMYLSLHAFKM